MQFTTAIATALLAALAQAENMVTFKSLDNVDRTVYFTSSPGFTSYTSLVVPAGQSVDMAFEWGWQGNWYAVHAGAQNVPGMLGEVKFNAFENKVFYDVSAIVAPNDMDNVREIYPISDPNKPVSGCKFFPCNNAYYLPDDVQTRVSQDAHLVCTLGRNDVYAKRDVEEVEDDYPRFGRDAFQGF